MMASHALHVLRKVIYRQLVNETLWGAEVYPERAPAKASRPYVVYFHVAGGNEVVTTGGGNARYIMTIKAVADRLEEALLCSQRIRELMDNHGSQEPAALPLHDDWDVTTTTRGRTVSVPDMFAGALPLYHEGDQYEFVMEEN